MDLNLAAPAIDSYGFVSVDRAKTPGKFEFGVQALIGRYGAINTLLGSEIDVLGNAKFWGCVLVDSLHLYPIIYLNATAALANLDPALEEAADNLGSSAGRRFWKVTLPLIRPGLFAGATIVFIWSFTELGTPLIFDYTQVTPVQIFNGLKEIEASPAPYALVVTTISPLRYVGDIEVPTNTIGRIGMAEAKHPVNATIASFAFNPFSARSDFITFP